MLVKKDSKIFILHKKNYKTFNFKMVIEEMLIQEYLNQF